MKRIILIILPALCITLLIGMAECAFSGRPLKGESLIRGDSMFAGKYVILSDDDSVGILTGESLITKPIPGMNRKHCSVVTGFIDRKCRYPEILYLLYAKHVRYRIGL